MILHLLYFVQYLNITQALKKHSYVVTVADGCYISKRTIKAKLRTRNSSPYVKIIIWNDPSLRSNLLLLCGTAKGGLKEWNASYSRLSCVLPRRLDEEKQHKKRRLEKIVKLAFWASFWPFVLKVTVATLRWSTYLWLTTGRISTAEVRVSFFLRRADTREEMGILLSYLRATEQNSKAEHAHWSSLCNFPAVTCSQGRPVDKQRSNVYLFRQKAVHDEDQCSL